MILRKDKRIWRKEGLKQEKKKIEIKLLYRKA
jgi:hypothetical protein